MIAFLKEEPIKSCPNKSYSIQLNIEKPLANLYYDVSLGVESDKERPFAFEFNICGLIGFTVVYTRHTDHAGFHFEVTFLSSFFDVSIYDIRHWDYDEDRWKTYA